LGVQLLRVEALELRGDCLDVRAPPCHGLGRQVRDAMVVARDAEKRRRLRMLVERAVEFALEERPQGLVGRRLRRACDPGGEGGQRGRGAQRRHSTFPIFFTTSASLVASASQKVRKRGWSRY